MIDLQAAVPWIVGISILMFVASLILLPWLILAMPADYFASRQPRLGWLKGRHPLVRWGLLVMKNFFGLLLVVVGLVMLVTPGQGLLSVLIGVLMLDLPGKRALERKILCRPGILNALNKIRTKAGKQPLLRPAEAKEIIRA